MTIELLFTEDEREKVYDSTWFGYTHGMCYAFAIGLYRITGWQLVVLDVDDVPMVHAGVRDSHGMFWDARGALKESEFMQRFANVSQRTAIRNISITDITKALPHLDAGTLCAERYASMFFPDLPHVPESDRERNIAFVKAVTEISKKYRLWIQGRSPIHQWPVISASDRDGWETGYTVVNTPRGYTFDRATRGHTRKMPQAACSEFRDFFTELTAISEAHHLWIRAGIPTTWPRIARNADNRPERYVLVPTQNAAGFFINIAQ